MSLPEASFAPIEDSEPMGLPIPPDYPALEPLAPLPDAFGEDRLVLMARDPESAFIYWEITADGVGRARAALGSSAAWAGLNLRIYTGETGEPGFYDIGTQEWLGRYTLRLGRPGIRVSAAIGYLADGVFVHIAQSMPIRMPRRSPGPEPVRFVRVSPEHVGPQPAPFPEGLPASGGAAVPGYPGFPGATAASPTVDADATQATTAASEWAGSRHLIHPTLERNG